MSDKCSIKTCNEPATKRLHLQRLTNMTGKSVDDRVTEPEGIFCDTHAEAADGKCIEKDGKGYVQYALEVEDI